MDVAKETQWILEAEVRDVEGVVAIEGIHAFIERLDPGTWAIVTSAPRALAEARLRAVNLPIPAVMITAEDVQRGKPDPQGFLLGAARLGVPIDRMPGIRGFGRGCCRGEGRGRGCGDRWRTGAGDRRHFRPR